MEKAERRPEPVSSGGGGLRLALVFSLLVLAALLLGFFILLPREKKLAEIKGAHLLATDDGWVVQTIITNREDQEEKYAINVKANGAVTAERVVVAPGKSFSYLYHLHPHTIGQGEVQIAIYRGDEPQPMESNTFYLSPLSF